MATERPDMLGHWKEAFHHAYKVEELSEKPDGPETFDEFKGLIESSKLREIEAIKASEVNGKSSDSNKPKPKAKSDHGKAESKTK